MGQGSRAATLFVIVALLVSGGSARAQCVTEIDTPPGSDPGRITAGPDGNLWMTDGNGGVARMLLSSPNTFTPFPVSPGDIRPASIAAGPDGNLWFVEILGNNVGRIEPLSPNTITEFPIPTASTKPQDIVAGPDGNLWFTEGSGRVGRITPGSPNAVTEFPLPSGLGAQGITVGPDGNIWFAETFLAGNEGGDKIGRILPGSPNTITEFTIPTAGGSPVDITTGPDGNLWFTEEVGKIGRITPDAPNTITEFPIPTANSRPFGIVAGPDGNIWFAESTGRKIGRITPSSPETITEFTVPAIDITDGPDGNLWYTDFRQIVGRLRLDDCQGCVATKLKAIANAEKGRFDCLSKVATTGDASGLSECVAKAQSSFTARFASGGDCGSSQAACGKTVESCVTTVSNLLSGEPGKCQAAKLKATGKLAAAELTCALKSAARNRPLDPSCVTRAQGSFTRAFNRADASGPCAGESNLTRLFVEFFCLSQVGASDSSGRVMAAICQ